LLDNLAYSKHKLNETNGLPIIFSIFKFDSLKLTSEVFVNKTFVILLQKDTLNALKYSQMKLLLAKSTDVSRCFSSFKAISIIIEPKKQRFIIRNIQSMKSCKKKSAVWR
jgi:hypothetical protein